MTSIPGGGEPQRNRAGEERLSQLLEHARRTFSEKGYDATTLQDLTTSMGITRPLFYYYFSSKEDLLHDLIGNLGDDLLNQARPMLSSAEPAIIRLRRALDIHSHLLLANPDAFRIYLAERHRFSPKPVAVFSGERDYVELLASTIEAGQQEGTVVAGPPRVLALLVTGLLNSVLRWYVEDGPVPGDRVADLAVDTAIRGLSMHSGGR